MKKPKKFYDYAFAVLIGLAALVICVCAILWLFDQRFYLPPFSSGELCRLACWAIVFWIILWMGVHWCRRSRKWYAVAGKVLVLLLVILFVAYWLLLAAAFGGWMGDYQRYNSPDGQYSIIIEDESVLAVEWTTVYIMTSPVTMKELCGFGEVFVPNPQTVVWHDAYVELFWQKESQRFYYSQDE